MSITFQAITEPINALNIGNSEYIGLVGIILTVLTTIAITRNIQKIKVLLLPVGLSWQAVGVQNGYIPIAIYIIIYISEAVGYANIGQVITATADVIQQKIATGEPFIKTQKAMNKYKQRLENQMTQKNIAEQLRQAKEQNQLLSREDYALLQTENARQALIRQRDREQQLLPTTVLAERTRAIIELAKQEGIKDITQKQARLIAAQTLDNEIQNSDLLTNLGFLKQARKDRISMMASEHPTILDYRMRKDISNAIFKRDLQSRTYDINVTQAQMKNQLGKDWRARQALRSGYSGISDLIEPSWNVVDKYRPKRQRRVRR